MGVRPTPENPTGDAWTASPDELSPPSAWIANALAAALVGGVYLIVRGLNHGAIADVAISIYHVPAYGALGLGVVWIIGALSRAARSNPRRRGLIPVGLRLPVLGLALLVAYLPADLAWRSLIGIGGGIEGSLAPTRLLLSAGLALFAATPLAAAVRTGDPRLRVPAAVSGGLVAAGVGIAIIGYHPADNPRASTAAANQADSELWTMAADGSRQTRLVEAGDGYEYSEPVYSPDGTRIAYTRWQVDATGDSNAEIWTAAPDGTDRRRVTASANDDWIPSWSPNGTWIAFTSTPQDRLLSRSPQGPAPAPGAGGPAPAPAPGATVAPNAEGAEIWLVHPDGSERHQLTHDPGDDLVAVWSPDGRVLAIVADRDGTQQIYSVSVDGSTERRLTNDGATDWAPAWSPDGSRIVFTSGRTGSDQIWVMAADGSARTRLTQDSGNDQVPAWSPDGSRIAYVSDRTGTVEVWSMATDGTDQRNLSRSPSRNNGQWSVAWSPDGRTLIYASSALPDATSQPIVRDDLGAAGLLLETLILAATALLLLRVGPPFGTFGLVMGLTVGLAALVSDEWRFVPGAIVAGLLIDFLARRTGGAPKHLVAVAGLAAALPLSVGATLVVTGSLGWTPTLWLGVTGTAALIGSALAYLTGPWPGRDEGPGTARTKM